MRLTIIIACACAFAIALVLLLLVWIRSAKRRRARGGARARLPSRVQVHQSAGLEYTAKAVSVTTFSPDAIGLPTTTSTTRSEPLEQPKARVRAGGVSLRETSELSEHSEILVELE